jgi:hypothetical protein
VELVRSEGPDDEGAEEGGREEPAVLEWTGTERHREREDRDGDRDEAVRAVRLDEVVAGDGLRIQVMLAEGSDQRSADDGGFARAPGVGDPMDQARREVGGQVACEARRESDERSRRQVRRASAPRSNTSRPNVTRLAISTRRNAEVAAEACRSTRSS